MPEQIVINKNVEVKAMGYQADVFQVMLETNDGEAMYIGAFMFIKPGDILNMVHVYTTLGHYFVAPSKELAIAGLSELCMKDFDNIYINF